MIIKQLSIFLENKTGRLAEISEILGKVGINMSAFSVADSSDFGILRLIVSEPKKALEALKEEGFSVRLTDVLCLNVPNTPGALSKAMSILSEAKVEIEYMYAFSLGEDAISVIKPQNIEHCIEVLQAQKLELLASSSLYKL
ncbi:MAG: amino acid-binding protein [Bacteroidales bacterium]|jgi:hypothetical protein|nr:amino acid-binding protein [Bacteroidales bacterium]